MVRERRESRLSIQKSLWFDFFTASPRRKQSFLSNPDDTPTASRVISRASPPSRTAFLGHTVNGPQILS
jgi:hypothetical protein